MNERNFQQFNELIKTLEFPFCYIAYIIDSNGLFDYFHYGLWERDTYDFKKAQENLASLMKSLIPDGVQRILDVGCGLGRTTYDLTNLGYDVIGISPDEKLMNMARLKYNKDNLQLITSSFEDYKSYNIFDLILFQESTQYINLKTIFTRCRKLLNKNGYILMCDEIKYNPARTGFRQKERILKLAKKNGFKIIYNNNITQTVLKTRDFVLQELVNSKDSMVEVFSQFREKTEEEIRSFIEGVKVHNKMFEDGLLGYEIFLFKRETREFFRNIFQGSSALTRGAGELQ